MNLLVCGNKERDNLREVVQKAVAKLTQEGFNCIGDDLQIYENIEGLTLYSHDECDKLCDAIVSVGGDGTMLRHAQRAVRTNKTIFGINAGRLGFLCAFDINRLEELTKETVSSLVVENRALLDVSFSTDEEDISMLAINDMVVSKVAVEKTIGISVETGEKKIGNYRCDGMIVSTPTGSTAYNLSAGGPIIDPSMAAMVMTPICAHSFFHESFVFGSDKELIIKAANNMNAEICVMVDSYGAFKIKEGTSVKVKQSDRFLKLLVSNERDFYGILRNKIGEST